MPFDAFEVKEDGEKSKLEVKKEAFTSEEEELSYFANDTLNDIQKLLDAMSDELEELGLNKEESRLAHLAIERELEKSIPASFKDAYGQAEDWKEATDLITKNILGAVNKFIVKVDYLPEPTERLKEVEDIVDSESWSGSLSLAEVRDVMKAIDPNITPREIAAIQKQHSPLLVAEKEADYARAKGFAEAVAGGGAPAQASKKYQKKVEQRIRGQ